MVAIVAVAEVVLTSLIIGLLMVVVYLLALLLDLDVHIKRAWNAFVTATAWRPKSPLDKEIAEEEKEIAELERQKEKIDELANLKRRKERLFKEVHEETSSEYWKCPQCRREFKDLEGLNNHRAWEHRQ